MIASTPTSRASAGGIPRVVFAFTIAGGKIAAIDILADAARVAQLDLKIESRE